MFSISYYMYTTYRLHDDVTLSLESNRTYKMDIGRVGYSVHNTWLQVIASLGFYYNLQYLEHMHLVILSGLYKTDLTLHTVSGIFITQALPDLRHIIWYEWLWEVNMKGEFSTQVLRALHAKLTCKRLWREHLNHSLPESMIKRYCCMQGVIGAYTRKIGVNNYDR